MGSELHRDGAADGVVGVLGQVVRGEQRVVAVDRTNLVVQAQHGVARMPFLHLKKKNPSEPSGWEFSNE